MIGQEILDEIKSNYKRPKRIKVTPELFTYLELDTRIKHIETDENIPMFMQYDAIPLIIDKELEKDYEIEYEV